MNRRKLLRMIAVSVAVLVVLYFVYVSGTVVLDNNLNYVWRISYSVAPTTIRIMLCGALGAAITIGIYYLIRNHKKH